MKCNCVQHTLSILYKSLGSVIGRYPIYFILIPTILSAVFSSFIYRITYIRDGFYLYSPLNSQSFKDRDLILKLFPVNISHEYDVSRIVQDGKYVSLQITAKDGFSIFRREVFDEILSINSKVQNWSVEYDGESWHYDRLCARNNEICQDNVGLSLAKHIPEIKKGTYPFKYPIDINPLNFKVTPYVQNLGGVTVDETGQVLDALAFRLVYTLDFSKEQNNQILETWEANLIHNIYNTEFKYVKISIFGSTSFGTQVKDFTNSALPLCGLSIVSILVFSVLTCMTTDWIRSKPGLGISSCISSGLAVSATFGFVTVFGVGYADATIALPFLMLGMGIDDSFVLISAWRRTNPNDNVQIRMGESYAEAAVSITITSLTSFFSFCIGIIASLPVVRIFCTYAAAAIFFSYIYQITFFGACMALSGYREERKLHSVFCCYKYSNQIRKNSENRNQEDLILKFFRNKLGYILTKSPSKVVVLVLYAVNLAIAIWGITNLKEGLSMQKTLPANSKATEYFQDYYRHFSKYAHRIHVIITTPLNYADPFVQQKIEETLKSFEKNPFVADSSLTESWLRAFNMFANSSVSRFSLGAFDLLDKQDFIDGLNVFIKFPQTKNFQKDIVFNDDRTEIVASRFFLLCHDLKSGAEERQLLIDVRNIAKNSSIPVTVYSLLFPFYEQMVEAKSITIQTVCIAAFLVMVIFFLFIPNVMCALCVSAIIVTIEIETIGYMTWWDVNLDIFSLINLIMCVGFSVNYPSHITYAYVTSKDKDPNERLKTALYAVGMPIFQGSASTILGIIVLAFNPSYMFLVFVKIIFLVIFITAFHSLFVLPVILSIFDILFSKLCNFHKLPVSVSIESCPVQNGQVSKNELCPLKT